MISEDMRVACAAAAKKWQVSPEVHPDDFILRYLLDSPTFSSTDQALETYFEDGARSAQQLSALLNDVCGFEEQACQVLEFAAGYGRVTRHIKHAAPYCSVTACDIHPEAVRFISETLGIPAVPSTHVPEELRLDAAYDVVFALSFFSHMPKTTFSRWLQKLAALVKPEGYLIFTTHGLMSRRAAASGCVFDQDGFYFAPASEQKDLDEAEYGVAIALPRFVFSEIANIPQLTVAYFQEGSWWGHQDVFVLRAVSETLTPAPFSAPDIGRRARSFYHSLRAMVKRFRR